MSALIDCAAPACTAWGWKSIAVPTGGAMEMHIVPHDDIAAHNVYGACMCGAEPDDEIPEVVIHNAYDGREAYERGARKAH